MMRSEQRRSSALAQLSGMAGLFILLVAATAVQAQTFTVLHSFSGPDGANPAAGLILDGAGDLYGTTEFGGNMACTIQYGCGTVFKLAHTGSGWVLDQLYKFSGSDGDYPEARVIFGADGTLYGTTYGGGSGGGGTLFNLRPRPTVCRSVSCPWIEAVLFPFDFGTGYSPQGDITFDAAGNIYGTAPQGGMLHNCNSQGCGVAYELTQSGGVWTEDILYNFVGGNEGSNPNSGVIFDQAGNLYGTAVADLYGGSSNGLVFELSPSGSAWTQTVLYRFPGGEDGRNPFAGLVFDPAGNLFGATSFDGSGNGGTVYELSPSAGGWNFNLLYSLSGGSDPEGPYATLVRGSAGNLYGTTLQDGAYGYGSVFRLSPSNGSWTYTSLHDFTHTSDGAYPYGGLVLDTNGNIFGTAWGAGNTGSECAAGCGVIFEVTP
jgi:uncharacterized repeat protein (TIGR03803 family)